MARTRTPLKMRKLQLPPQPGTGPTNNQVDPALRGTCADGHELNGQHGKGSDHGQRAAAASESMNTSPSELGIPIFGSALSVPNMRDLPRERCLSEPHQGGAMNTPPPGAYRACAKLAKTARTTLRTHRSGRIYRSKARRKLPTCAQA